MSGTTQEMLLEAEAEYEAAWYALSAAEYRLKAATRRVAFRQLRADIEDALGPLDPMNEEWVAIWPMQAA